MIMKGGLVVLVLCGSMVGQLAAAPLVAGDLALAGQFLGGNAHVVILGDSEQNGLQGTYPARLPIRQWSGEVAGPNFGGSVGNTGTYDFYFNPAYVAAQNHYTADQVGPAGAAIAPGVTHQLVFNANPITAGTTGGPGTLLDRRLYEVGLGPTAPGAFYSGPWADKATGTINVDVLYVANPNGVPAGNVNFDVRLNSATVPLASIPINAQSATTSIQMAHASFPAQAWNAGQSITGAFRVADGVTSLPAGSNLAVVGVRYSTGQPGFQYSNIAYGGRGVDYFLSPANSTDAALAQYLTLTDSNVAYVWLGQNDLGQDDAAAWKAKMQALVTRYKAARPGMQFVLVSPYDTGNPRLADYAQDLYEIAQADPRSVLFLNLYAMAGDFEHLDENYLIDHVHENAAGNPYAVDQVNKLLAMARELEAAQAGTSVRASAAVPEPTAAALMIMVVAVSLRRPRARPRRYGG